MDCGRGIRVYAAGSIMGDPVRRKPVPTGNRFSSAGTIDDWFETFLNTIPTVARRKKQRRELDLDPHQPYTMLAYASVFNCVHKAGFSDKWGNHGLHLFRRGCFRRAVNDSVELRLNHYETPVLAKTSNGSMTLSEDDIGLLVQCTVNPATAVCIHSGRALGLSIMGLREKSCNLGGVTHHELCGLEEISICTKAPGCPLTAAIIVEMPEPVHLRQAAIDSSTPLKERRSFVVRRLLRMKREIAC